MTLVSAGVRRDGTKVLFINHETHLGLELQGWEDADHFALCMKRVAQGSSLLGTRVSKSVRIIRSSEQSIIVEARGNVFIELPNAVALEFCNLIIGQARLIEQDEKAADISFDQALLIRSGALPGLGLTDNKDIQEMAAQEAAWNTTLRRALPGSVKQQIQYGTPSVKKGT